MILFTVLYGRNPIYELELFGSVWSALNHLRDTAAEIVVFTDRENLDNFPLPITSIRITSDEWERWTDSGKFKHLVKMYCMKKVLTLYNRKAIYFDTDVIFGSSIKSLSEKLSRKTTLMHANEGPIGREQVWRDLLDSMRREGKELGENITRHSLMFNSGIVGMLPEHMHLIDRAIGLAQDLYRCRPIFNIEQFATGSALLASTRVETCEREVLHYWGWRRPFVHVALKKAREIFDRCGAPDESLKCLTHDFPPIHILDRILSRLRYPYGAIADSQRFSYLAYRSAIRRFSSRDYPMANVWLSKYLDDLVDKSGYVGYSAIGKMGARRYLENITRASPCWINESNAERIAVLLDV